MRHRQTQRDLPRRSFWATTQQRKSLGETAWKRSHLLRAITTGCPLGERCDHAALCPCRSLFEELLQSLDTSLLHRPLASRAHVAARAGPPRELPLTSAVPNAEAEARPARPSASATTPSLLFSFAFEQRGCAQQPGGGRTGASHASPASPCARSTPPGRPRNASPCHRATAKRGADARPEAPGVTANAPRGGGGGKALS